MAKKRHKNDTKRFGEETFAEQAKTISASSNNFFNAIRRHVEHSPRPAETRQKCIAQVQRLLDRVNRIPPA